MEMILVLWTRVGIVVKVALDYEVVESHFKFDEISLKFVKISTKFDEISIMVLNDCHDQLKCALNQRLPHASFEG